MCYQATPLLLSMLMVYAWAYPSGAPSNITNPMDMLTSRCTSAVRKCIVSQIIVSAFLLLITPNHGDNLAQASPAPYQITVSSPSGAVYEPGRLVTITIEGKASSPLKTFKGFFLQGDSTEMSFAGDITCEDQGKKVTYCGKSGATQVNAQVKERVTCQWNPPDFQIGRVQFVATVVENFTTFWTGVKSSTTLLANPTTMTYAEKTRQMREHLLSQQQPGQSASAPSMNIREHLGRLFGST